MKKRTLQAIPCSSDGMIPYSLDSGWITIQVCILKLFLEETFFLLSRKLLSYNYFYPFLDRKGYSCNLSQDQIACSASPFKMPNVAWQCLYCLRWTLIFSNIGSTLSILSFKCHSINICMIFYTVDTAKNARSSKIKRI